MLDVLIMHFANGNKSNFAKRLGLSPQAINTWQSRNTFNYEIIYAKCEGVCPHWLLTGEGSMLKDEKEKDSICAKEQPVVDLYEGKAKRGLPYYDKDMVEFCGTDTETLACLSIDDYFCERADLYCTCCEHSMSPCIRYGDILALKEVCIEDILYGEVYAILMERERLIRQIKSSHDDLSLTFIPYNSDFEPQIFKKSSIIKVYRVVGSVHRFT